MNHKKQYDALIVKALNRNWVKNKINHYTENHHIIPKSIGGDDSTNNIVCLTAKEHFIAHLLLAEIYGGSLVFAALSMSRQKNSYQERDCKINSILYQKLKIINAKEVGKRMKKANLGKKQTKEHIEKRKKSLKKSIASGKYVPHGGPKTNEHKQKISNSRKANGKPWLSSETRAKISQSLSGKKYGKDEVIKCPHCSKAGGKKAMKRWHFDNCKFYNS